MNEELKDSCARYPDNNTHRWYNGTGIVCLMPICYHGSFGVWAEVAYIGTQNHLQKEAIRT